MSKISFADKLKNLFGIAVGPDESFFDDLADSLIEGDLGAKTAVEVVELLEKQCKEKKITDPQLIKTELAGILRSFVKMCPLNPESGKVNIYLLLGVNGVGKTTTCAKLAQYYHCAGFDPVVLAAADTFRAAAIEQLVYHAAKLGVRVVAHQHGSDPGAVVFDAADAIASKGGGLVLADTAGRLHNKDNLVNELKKIDRIAAAKADCGCYKKIMVLDATTGQNGLRQAEVFHESVGLDALILTKYDSTARGGIACAAGKELSLPIAFTGFGETYGDIALFDPDTYIAEFTGC